MLFSEMEALLSEKEGDKGKKVHFIEQEAMTSNLVVLLCQKVSERTPILSPADERLLILEQILQGVNQLHRIGLVHMDLKPENILFRYEDNRLIVKIADFGLS